METPPSEPEKRAEPLALVAFSLPFVGWLVAVGIWLLDHITDNTILTVDITAGLLLWLPSVICGHKAVARIRRAPTELAGTALARIGMTFSYLGLLALLGLGAIAILFSNANMK